MENGLDNWKYIYIHILVQIRGDNIPRGRLEKSALQLIESLQDGVLVTDIDGNILKANKKFEKITGFSEDKVLGENAVKIAEELVKEEYLEKVIDILEGNFENVEAEGYNLMIKSKEGDEKCIHLKTSFAEDRNGRTLSITILSDVTKINEAERKLEEKNQQMETLLSNLSGMAYRCLNNKDYTMKFVSEGSKKLTGYEPDDLIGNKKVAYGELIIPDDRGYVWDEIQSAIEKDEPFKISYRIDTSEGETKWVWEQGRHIIDKSGNRFLEGFITDITKRKEAEEEYRESNLRAQLQRASIADLVLDPAIASGDLDSALNRITKVLSKALNVERASVWLLEDDKTILKCLKLYESEKEDYSEGMELETKTFPKYFSAIREESRIYADNAQIDPRSKGLTEDYLKPLNITSMLDAGIQVEGEIIGVVCAEHIGEPRHWHPDEEAFVSTIASIVAQQITNVERKKAERALRESERSLKYILEAIQDGLCLLDTELNIKYVNPTLNEWYSENIPLEGKKCYECFHEAREPLDPCPAMRSIENGTVEKEIIHGLPGSDFGWLEFYSYPMKDSESGEITGVVEIIRDVTERKKMEDAIKESEERLDLAMAVTNEGIWDWDLRTNEVYYDPRYYEMAGYNIDAFPHRLDEFKQRVHNDDIDHVMTEAEKHIDGESEKFDVEFRFERSDGDYMWIRGRGRIVERNEDGEPIRFVGTHADITERKIKEERIKHLNSLLRSIRNVNQLITQEDDILKLMKKSRRLLMETRGYSKVSIFLIDEGEIYEKVGGIGLDEFDLKKEELLNIKDPSIVSCEKEDFCSTRAIAPIIDDKLEGILAVENLEEIDDEELGLLMEIASDLAMAINKIKAEERLKRSLREKEILLDEIHHRVKNNLQVVSSLLKLQASEKGDKDPLTILKEGRNRVQSMALIHDMLHRSDDMASIDLKTYIDELIRSIYQTYNVSYGEVELETDMGNILLGIDQANPCVQVINEIISNSLQHAFPDDYEGKKKLKVSTKLTDDQNIEIVISDNGVGIPEKVDLESSETFGFRLIHMLVVDQLDGDVEVIRDGGTTFKIRFRKEGDIIDA